MVTNRFLFFGVLIALSGAQLQADSIFERAWGFVTSPFHKEPTANTSTTIEMGPHDALIVKNGTNGSTTISAWPRSSLLIEVEKRGPQEDLRSTTVNTKRGDHTITLETETKEGKKPVKAALSLVVPEHAAVTIEQEGGNVTIKDVLGPINIQTHNGSIEVKNASDSVTAKAHNGSITVEQAKLTARNTIFLDAEKNITLLLPGRTNANLLAKAPNGRIYSEHYVTLRPVTIKINKETVSALLRDVDGTLGSGGASIVLESLHGIISIEEW